MPVKERSTNEIKASSNESDSISSQRIKTKKETCFIITPIGDENSPIRRHIDGIIEAAISPALLDKYEIKVAHKISEPGSITKQIVAEIYNAKLVVANLTERNPNVMYELALRHAIGKPVIMIAERGTPLPSDVIMQRVIFYNNDAMGVLDLKSDLVESENKIDFTNVSGPINEIMKEIIHDTKALQNIKEIEKSDITSFEYILNRLDRIESNIIRNHSDDIRRVRTYRIYKNDTPQKLFEERIRVFIEQFRVLDYKIRYRFLEEFCSIQLIVTPSTNYKIFEQETAVFCEHYEFKYEAPFAEAD